MVTLFNGLPSESRKYTQAFHDLKPISSSSDEIEYPHHPAAVLSSQSDPACQKLGSTASALRFPIDLDSYNVTAMRSLYEVFDKGIKDEAQLDTSMMMIEGYSVQAVQSVPDESTAVPFRSKRLLLSPAIFVPASGGASLERTGISWGQRMRGVLREGAGGEMLSYVNYAHGDEGVEAWFGHDEWRLEKLMALKKAWDPKCRFSGYAPIPCG